jgi:PiT family inorganic phosphate transporter/sodium-dependent phosphate transporter
VVDLCVVAFVEALAGHDSRDYHGVCRSVSLHSFFLLSSSLHLLTFLSVGVGNSVADTIRTKIVEIDAFKENAPLLMLGMCCAVVASSIYLTICTKIGLPVSTTHSILGGILGMGIALIGADDVIWWGGDINSGVVQVFLAWVIAPLLSGVAGALIFLITKYGILLRPNAALKALYTVPFYFLLTSALLTSLCLHIPNTFCLSY